MTTTADIGEANAGRKRFSSFSVLEELFLHYPDNGGPPAWNGKALNPSIRRLTIIQDFPDYPEAQDHVWVNTPSLVYLDYSVHVSGCYEANLGSLVEARLDLQPWEKLVDDDLGDVTSLVAMISNVKTLHLSSDSLEVLHSLCQSMPVFHNLLTLSFESDKERGWQVVPLLLNSSPNLETLVIKGLVHKVTSRCGDVCLCIPKKKSKKVEEGVCSLTTCQVKVLNISGYRGTCSEQKQMIHFLGNLKCLETVKVGVKVDHGEDNDTNDIYTYLRITNALMKLSTVSSNCRIHIL
ncbi:PREDICTED: putative F-box protein At1g21990 [Camelina sativa]|uniref:F-box protein At1g21990 n=1 Tax=Camelina sativa TaxID=90675 RepID=A0ABM0X4N2_CAMSA|nr:PREDICTED: putative F-box protein At1g21990 [Camelina sativa]